MGFNVLTDRCFPVVMRSGERRWVDFAGLACGFPGSDEPEAGVGDAADDAADYAVAFDWPRPDLDMACYELCVGVLQLCLDVFNDDRWEELWFSSVGREDLAERIAPFTHAFELLGGGARFLQDREAFEADLKPAALSPVEGLFIDTPGQNGQKKNADVLTHRGRYPALGLPAAAMTLYALQAFAPAGGAGNRTSMRGGGPLSVLVLPVAGEGRAPVSLWHRLLANVTKLAVGDAAAQLHTVLPWLAQTLTSDKGRVIHPDDEGDAHPLQAFFGMPRRLRLVADAQPGICALTGLEGPVVTHFAQRPYGMNYGIWQHPLTPYRQLKETEPPYSVKPKTARFGYRDWVAVAVGEGAGSLSRLPGNISAARQDRVEPLTSYGHDPVLRVGGWAMNNMEAMAYLLAEQPMHLARDRDVAQMLDGLVRSFSEAGSVALSALRDGLRKALFDGQTPDAEKGALGNAQAAFFEATEPQFHRLAAAFLNGGEDESLEARAERQRQNWRRQLEETVLSLFDQFAGVEDVPPERAQPVVEAYATLQRSCRGYGPGGKRFFEALRLPLPVPDKEKGKEKGKGVPKAKSRSGRDE
ncbi:type I-E CRISPR-associated protein Cse1/CasA [Pannonibacter indicus]|uniref:CRISPR type I-E/ECOLI-associated protein CasA/Cse1 n=1 Tax=Pannonibacter indicus TaxID=466044 RepID=A0A0K6IAE9_9HYPH|nr:type I-E CRISPR-associated protein Cse1/CasA [Pannonibacter indicus]CUB00018.1 CRISPR type I-E/ECOLI-associated protein CasA/Cse1 [Pannonibacter indicus]